MLLGQSTTTNVIVICLIIIAFLLGTIELACLWVHYYPSANNLNKLYAAVYLTLPFSIVFLYWSLFANNFKQLLVRSYGWIIVLTCLIFLLAKVA